MNLVQIASIALYVVERFDNGQTRKRKRSTEKPKSTFLRYVPGTVCDERGECSINVAERAGRPRRGRRRGREWTVRVRAPETSWLAVRNRGELKSV